MLLVDERIGSKDLLTPLQMFGVPAALAHLEFADFAFIGRGIEGADVSVGIELKETRDLIGSLQSSRFTGHQLPGLVRTYDRVWLLTEGIWRAGAGGIFEVMAGGWRAVRGTGARSLMLNDIESWILTQTIRGGIGYWHSSTRHDTIRFISVLYHWWTDKSLDEHRSHQAIYRPPPDRAMMVEPSTFQQMVSCIPGVGWEKSGAIEDQGYSMVTLCAADVLQLRRIDGIGPKIAKTIVDTLRKVN